ncbi:endoribonuclease CG2145 isoform X2 [Anabrus simplex]|uniref:endoribonuclease CG2145 isoform X2 n=1 Tax=Anabrus simplex TaxID=316456 RepID=UPI0035A299A5
MSGATVGKVPDEALQKFSEEIFDKDVNNAYKFIRVNYQSRTRSNSLKDEAPLPLITVDTKALQIPTVAKVRVMYNNYVPDTLVNEQVTKEEISEEDSLLDTFIKTPIMVHTMKFLADNRLVKRDPRAFKEFLRKLWFGLYSRGNRKVGSSSFEHIFLAELKRGEISGMHNWIYFSNEEAKKTADYLGYMRKLELGGKGAILKLHYKWSNVMKPVGTMFVGTSPELEMALYTVCFMTRPDEKCSLKLGGKVVGIKTHTFRYKGYNYIGSAFPDI